VDFSLFDTFKNQKQETPAFMHASDGVPLAFYHHVARQATTQGPIFIFYHGGGACQVVARPLATIHGISSYLFDIRRRWRSGGIHGDAQSPERVLLDVQEGMLFMHAQHPGPGLLQVVIHRAVGT
jgi:hypothetical protein